MIATLLTAAAVVILLDLLAHDDDDALGAPTLYRDRADR